MGKLWCLLWKDLTLQVHSPWIFSFQFIFPSIFSLFFLPQSIVHDAQPKRLFDSYFVNESSKHRILTFAYAPKTNATDTIMMFMERVMFKENKDLHRQDLTIRGFPTKDGAIKDGGFPFIILFKNAGEAAPKELRYAILVTSGHPLSIDISKPLFEFPPSHWPDYGRRCRSDDPDVPSNKPFHHKEDQIVSFIQLCVMKAFMQFLLQGTKSSVQLDLHLATKCFPLPSHKRFDIGTASLVMPPMLILGFMSSTALFMQSLVIEREDGLKENLFYAGMNAPSYFISVLLTWLIIFLPVAALTTLAYWAIAVEGSPMVMFCLLLCYGLALAMFSYLIYIAIQDDSGVPVVLAAASLILYYRYITPQNFFGTSYWAKLPNLLSFNTAFYVGLSLIAFSDSFVGTPTTMNNIFKPVMLNVNIQIGEVMLFLLINACISNTLAECIRRCRLLSKRTWTSKHAERSKEKASDLRKGTQVSGSQKSLDFGMKRSSSDVESSKYFEEDPSDLRMEIQVSGVRKEYGKKVAVDNFTMSFYRDQITIILGHNGSGKSTLMSIISGRLEATEGEVFVNDIDIRQDAEEVRNQIGVCPQNNLLYDQLTPQEHLSFYAQMAGLSYEEESFNISRLSEEIGLTSFHDRNTEHLSVGQKKMVSLALALLGDPKVLILDEPSTGMDIAKRQECWSVLRNASIGRTVLMSTHYMDEAEALGDRIAIMVDGRLECCGSRNFLGEVYGANYHLLLSVEPNYDSETVVKEINRIIPKASLEKDEEGNVSIALPVEQRETFSEVFKILEEKRYELGVYDFGLATATMEQIFLKVNEYQRLTDAGNKSPDYLFESNKSPASKEDLPKSSASNSGEDSSKLPSNASSTTLFKLIETIDEEAKEEEEKEKEVVEEDGEDEGEEVEEDEDEKDADLIPPKRPVKLQKSKLLVARVKALLYKRQKMAVAEQSRLIWQILGPFLIAVWILDGEADLDMSEKELSLPKSGGLKVPFRSNRRPEMSQVTDKYRNIVNKRDSSAPDRVPSRDEISYDNYTLKKIEQYGLPTILTEMLIGFDISYGNASKDVVVTALYSSLPTRARDIAVNYALNAVLQFEIGEEYTIQASVGIFKSSQITNANATVPIGSDIILKQELFQRLMRVSKINVPLSFMPLLAAHFASLEMTVGSRELNALSGAGPILFWLCSLIWDYFIFLVGGIPLFITIIIKVYSGLEVSQWLMLCYCFILYGGASVTFAYFVQILCESPIYTLTMCLVWGILSGCVGQLIRFLVLGYVEQDLAFSEILTIYEYLAMITSPVYNIGSCFYNIERNKFNMDICRQQICAEKCSPYDHLCPIWTGNLIAWNEPGIGSYLTAMILQTVTFSSITILTDMQVFERMWPGETKGVKDENEDDDVATERQRVEREVTEDDKTDVLTIFNMFEAYDDFQAVNLVTVGVTKGECFGLLGQNGAGKSVLFKCLSGDSYANSGQVFAMGEDIYDARLLGYIGYCPQLEGLIPTLTGRDQIEFHARLHGIPEKSIQKRVASLGKLFQIENLLDEACRIYSAADKRKLSIAIAMVGAPPILLLDDPSHNLDHIACLRLWSVLNNVRKQGSTLIMASHRIEECEALMTRIAIMMKGSFKALGSVKHLKDKFDKGFILTLRLPTRGKIVWKAQKSVEKMMELEFPQSTLLKRSNNRFSYTVVHENMEDMVKMLEESVTDNIILDYQIQSTTLEQVFLSLVDDIGDDEQADNEDVEGTSNV